MKASDELKNKLKVILGDKQTKMTDLTPEVSGYLSGSIEALVWALGRSKTKKTKVKKQL